MNPSLIEKYNVPVPRYTSYPTVPHWDKNSFTLDIWKSKVKEAFQVYGKKEGISVYIHLPYCESLCTYCGCNTRITINHAVERPYIEHVIQEWKSYVALLGEKPVIQELHLGGGTPTFFSPENLRYLIQSINAEAIVSPYKEYSFEGHPANTTKEHLQTLFEEGFTRVSFGIQDFDPKVQDTIHRFQSKEQVAYVTNTAREIGYTSVNFDLVYGLPFQTIVSIQDTFSVLQKLRPDRIAFYSYAHVPWLKPGQRKYTELDLPDNAFKRSLYETGREIMESEGYMEIGMDHFSLPEDSLAIALNEGKLHRNFMGYTTCSTTMLIGLGCSSISDVGLGYAQNPKVVETYFAQVEKEGITAVSGHISSDEDRQIREWIKSLICTYQLNVSLDDMTAILQADGGSSLLEMVSEGLIHLTAESISVTEVGKSFIRNICACLDPYYSLEVEKPMFSKSI
ncbi:MAG: oxygen-independent coproporphyrinogen III oxidase [Cytophagaceae bacterium]